MPARPTNSRHLARTLLDKLEVAPSMRKQEGSGMNDAAVIAMSSLGLVTLGVSGRCLAEWIDGFCGRCNDA
jgi:hypothetical protein